MLAKITVADYMAKRLVTLTKDTNVIDAIKKLLDHKITCAPVIDSKGQLIGMFSEKDLLKVFSSLALLFSISENDKIFFFLKKSVAVFLAIVKIQVLKLAFFESKLFMFFQTFMNISWTISDALFRSAMRAMKL